VEVERGHAYQLTPAASTQAVHQSALCCFPEYAGRRGVQMREGGSLYEAGEA